MSVHRRWISLRHIDLAGHTALLSVQPRTSRLLVVSRCPWFNRPPVVIISHPMHSFNEEVSFSLRQRCRCGPFHFHSVLRSSSAGSFVASSDSAARITFLPYYASWPSSRLSVPHRLRKLESRKIVYKPKLVFKCPRQEYPACRLSVQKVTVKGQGLRKSRTSR